VLGFQHCKLAFRCVGVDCWENPGVYSNIKNAKSLQSKKPEERTIMFLEQAQVVTFTSLETKGKSAAQSGSSGPYSAFSLTRGWPFLVCSLVLPSAVQFLPVAGSTHPGCLHLGCQSLASSTHQSICHKEGGLQLQTDALTCAFRTVSILTCMEMMATGT
jgi:hypothetical protein